MTFERLITILSLINAAAAACAGLLGELNPKYATIALIISVATGAVTKPLIGGNPEIKPFILTEDERAIIEIHREKEQSK